MTTPLTDLLRRVEGAPIIALPPVYPGEPEAEPMPPRRGCSPEPGDVYTTTHGNFLVVISQDQRGNYRYLTFGPDGVCRSPGQTGPCWLQGKPLVGRVRLPTLVVEPIDA